MVTIVIQAGGRSSRMGQDKGLVLLAGKPLIEHILERVAGFGDQLLLITNQPQNYAYLGLPMASDPVPGAGALPGLHTALQAANGEHILLIACDMPFIQGPLLEKLLALRFEADLVVPFWENNYQTTLAVYARRPCLAAVSAALQRGEKRLISFYEEITVLKIDEEAIKAVDPAGISFFNINTPAELAEAALKVSTAVDTSGGGTG